MNKKEQKKEMMRAGLERISNGGARALFQPTEPQIESHTEPQIKQAGELPIEGDKAASAGKYGRMCAVVNNELKHKMEYIAWAEHTTIKQVLERAMAEAVAQYEAAHGEIIINN
jgi:hypothetical protein